MATWTFKTVPTELLEAAEYAAQDFASRGFTVKAETTDLGFPYTPTLCCKRQQTRIVVEIVKSLELSRIEEWVAYAKSSGQDFRVVVCLPSGSSLSGSDEAGLRALGVGYYVLEGNKLTEHAPANDLALNVELPKLGDLPMKVRTLLGPAYEMFQRALWREGFEDACQAFEAEARRYLKRHTRNKRILIVSKKGPVVLRANAINKMSMGQLAGAFANIQKKNRADSLIGATLKEINRDRIGAAHHKSKKRTETRLRLNVGKHMWSLINAFKLVVE